MWKCGRTAVALAFLLAAAAAHAQNDEILTFDGPTAVQTFDAHRLYVVVDTDGDTHADHLFRLWSDAELPRMREAWPRAHVEFTGRQLRIVRDGNVLAFALTTEAVPSAITGYGLNHEWRSKQVAAHRIIVRDGVAAYGYGDSCAPVWDAE